MRDVVVLDYGGVLTLPVRDSIEAWISSDRIRPQSLTRVLRAWLSRDAAPDNPLHLLEKGTLDEAEFSRLMARELETTDGSAVEPDGLLQRFFGGLEPDHAMVTLVRELRTQGVTTALLSNSWGNDYPRDLLDEIFDVQVISSEVGMRKPDPEIFELVAARAGVALGSLVFVDDGRPNVESARALGMTAHLHTDFASTRHALHTALPHLATGLTP